MTPDDDGYTAFVASQWRSLLRFSYLVTGDAKEAEELTQSSLVALYVAWPRVAPDRVNAYIRAVIVNGARKGWRRRSARELLMAAVPEVPAAAGNVDFEERRLIWDALARLPRRQRAVLVLRYYEGLGEQEIASVMGCSTGTVKSQASRALTKLRMAPDLLDDRGRKHAGTQGRT